MGGKGRKRQHQRPWQQPRSTPLPEAGDQRRRECRTKVAHANRVAAEQAAIEHERLHGQPKAAYQCRWCGRWHVGSPAG